MLGSTGCSTRLLRRHPNLPLTYGGRRGDAFSQALQQRAGVGAGVVVGEGRGEEAEGRGGGWGDDGGGRVEAGRCSNSWQSVLGWTGEYVCVRGPVLINLTTNLLANDGLRREIGSPAGGGERGCCCCCCSVVWVL